MQARYIQRGESVDLRPAREIAAGEIVIQNGLVGVAKIPIAAGELGSIALSGVFDVVKTAHCAFSTGSAVYWDAARQSAVTSGDVLLGLAAESAKLTDSRVRVILNSGGITVNSYPENSLNWQTVN